MYRTEFSGESIESLGKLLNDESAVLGERYRALRTLHRYGTEEAILEIAKCFTKSSALLKHDCAYLIGQLQFPIANTLLRNVVEDLKQHAIVRHEAAASLAALDGTGAYDFLQKYTTDSAQEVADTCQLALSKLDWVKTDEAIGFDFKDNPFKTNDPAPPFMKGSMSDWVQLINDESLSLFDKYRVMYSLRNTGTDEAVDALISSFQSKSVLYRHELAFVLGQLKNKRAIPALQKFLEDTSENGIVRHECTEALTQIAIEEKNTPVSNDCLETIRRFQNDNEQLVRESCAVSLEELAHELNSDD